MQDVADSSNAPLELKPDYFIDHFWCVIDGVEKLYPHILNSEERLYVKSLRQLSDAALLLYVRLANRKGPYFRQDKIAYLAPAMLQDACDELIHHRLMAYCAENIDRRKFTALYTAKELQAALKTHDLPPFQRKNDLSEWLHQWDDFPLFCEQLATQSLLQFHARDCWKFFRYLYFGEERDNLSDFVTHALGHIVVEQKQADMLVAKFKTRAAACDSFRLTNLYQEFRDIRAELEGDALYQWWQKQKLQRTQIDEEAHDIFHRLIDRLGRLFERQRFHNYAVEIYQHSNVAPARERLARLLIKQGDKDAARLLCKQMLDAPTHSDEDYAARQILARLNKDTKRSDARALLGRHDMMVLDYQGPTC